MENEVEALAWALPAWRLLAKTRLAMAWLERQSLLAGWYAAERLVPMWFVRA